MQPFYQENFDLYVMRCLRCRGFGRVGIAGLATKYLPKCFMSLVQQTIGIDQIELIFVDDASTDGGATWNMLQEFERAYPESIITTPVLCLSARP